MNELLLPLVTTFVYFVFFVALIEQYNRKRKAHQFIWAVAMLFFTITTGAQLIAHMNGSWDPLFYRVYYVLASFQVFVMGIGVVYLLASRESLNDKNIYSVIITTGLIWTFFSLIYLKNSQTFLLIMIPSLLVLLYGIIYALFSLVKPESAFKFKVQAKPFSHFTLAFSIFIFTIFISIASTWELDAIFLSQAGNTGGEAWVMISNARDQLYALPRNFSPFFTVPGALFLIGGSLYSYLSIQSSIKKTEGKYNPSIGLFAIYIALGAIILTAGGALSRFGYSLMIITEFIGGLLMFFGFIESDKISIHKFFDIFRRNHLSTH